MNIQSIIAKMTLEDKISLYTGADFWHSKKMEQYGIPAFTMPDGPHGLRCQSSEADMIGINESLPATCFPTAVTAGAAWDRSLYAAEAELSAAAQAARGAKVAVVVASLPGQAGGEACANLLTGKAVPSGKLTERWPLAYADVISKDTFGQKNAEYRESIYVGHRYYDKAGKAVRFPFVHGLSYTEFAYSDLEVKDNAVSVAVSVAVTNTGKCPGS